MAATTPAAGTTAAATTVAATTPVAGTTAAPGTTAAATTVASGTTAAATTGAVVTTAVVGTSAVPTTGVVQTSSGGVSTGTTQNAPGSTSNFIVIDLPSVNDLIPLEQTPTNFTFISQLVCKYFFYSSQFHSSFS